MISPTISEPEGAIMGNPTPSGRRRFWRKPRPLGLSTVALMLTAILALGPRAHAAVIKSVQRGAATFTSGQNTLLVTLTAVDATKTIVWGGIQWGGGRNASTNAT